MGLPWEHLQDSQGVRPSGFARMHGTFSAETGTVPGKRGRVGHPGADGCEENLVVGLRGPCDVLSQPSSTKLYLILKTAIQYRYLTGSTEVHFHFLFRSTGLLP